jgi:hypothetical protein
MVSILATNGLKRDYYELWKCHVYYIYLNGHCPAYLRSQVCYIFAEELY